MTPRDKRRPVSRADRQIEKILREVPSRTFGSIARRSSRVNVSTVSSQSVRLHSSSKQPLLSWKVLRAMEKEEEEVPRERTMRTALGSVTAPATDEGVRAVVMSVLPQEIVEKIIGKIPYPSFFKAAGLSKSWRARFSAISSLEDEEERGLAARFQKQVIGNWSKDWDTFCLVYMSRSQEDLVAYDLKSRNWRRFSLSFLPEFCREASRSRLPEVYNAHIVAIWPVLKIDGALLYGSFGKELHVADILTQRRMVVPSPVLPGRVICSKILRNMSLGTYKILFFSISDSYTVNDCHFQCLNHFCARTYDSTSGTWSTQHLAVGHSFFGCYSSTDHQLAGAACLNGVLYLVSAGNVEHFLAFNLADGTLEAMRLSLNDQDRKPEEVRLYLLVCNDNQLMMVLWKRGSTLRVLRVDLQSRQLIEVSRAPFSVWRPEFSGHGNFIFVKTQIIPETSYDVHAYNMVEDAWSLLPLPALVPPFEFRNYDWTGFSFQPSLGPFVAL